MLVIALAPLLWAGNFVVAYAVAPAIPPVSLAFWRWVIAFVILLPLTGPAIWRCRRVIAQQWLLIVVLGATGLAGFSLLSYQALTLTSAVNAVLLFAAAPVLTPPLARLLLREPLTLRTIASPIISLIGAVVIIVQGDLIALLALRFNPGDLIMLIAVPIWSLYTVLLNKRPAELPLSPLLTMTMGAAVALLAPIYAAQIANGEQTALDQASSLGLLYIAFGASIGGFFCWSYGVSRLGPNQAGSFIHLTPVFGVLLSIAFFDADLAAYHLIGAGMVGCGLALSRR